jgi:hypothetical protein
MLSKNLQFRGEKKPLRKPLTLENKLLESNFLTLVDIEPFNLKNHSPFI